MTQYGKNSSIAKEINIQSFYQFKGVKDTMDTIDV